ncbi:MAG: peptidylprolyl isomerase [Gammaproteobacteria bacterium]|nr:peptidylprolyl isomerase [Gammaproteobacteria bacterium]
MTKVEKGVVVAVTYSVESGGEMIERIDLPVNILYGEDSGLLHKVEAALEGRSVGEQLVVELNPAEGFGEVDPALIFADKRENVPAIYHQLGAEAEFQNEGGEVRKFVVTKIDASTITLDGNHPFAGKDITFRIKIDSIRQPTAAELQNGVDRTPGGALPTSGGGTLH